MSRDAIFEKIQEVLDDALGVDIDFLDIVFRIEKTFEFKISQGELFPENLTDNPDWVSDGNLTDTGLAMLKERMAHVDFASIEDGDRSISKIGDLITVDSLVNFVEIKLAG